MAEWKGVVAMRGPAYDDLRRYIARNFKGRAANPTSYAAMLIRAGIQQERRDEALARRVAAAVRAAESRSS